MNLDAWKVPIGKTVLPPARLPWPWFLEEIQRLSQRLAESEMYSAKNSVVISVIIWEVLLVFLPMVKSTWTCHYRPLHPLPACEAHDDGLPKFSLEEAPFKGIDIGLGCRLWRGVRPLRLPLIPMLPWTQSGWMASEPKHRRWRLVAWLHKEVLLQCPGPRM